MSERNQVKAVISAIVGAVDLDKINFDLQEIILAVNQGKLGPALTKWIVDKGWLPPCPPPLPVNRTVTIKEALGRGWSVWRGSITGNGLDPEGAPDQDPRSVQIVEVDPNRVVTYTGLVGNETVIIGEERLKRMRAQTGIILFDFWTLWALYAESGQKTLRQLYDDGKIGGWLEELGIILRCPSGFRYSLFLYRGGGGSWAWSCCWLGVGRDASGPAVGLAS